MSDIAPDGKSVETDFQYDIKFNKREFFNNPGKDRFVIEDGNNNDKKYERGKLGYLRQRDFPIIPSISMKDVKQVDYNALSQWQSSQPQPDTILRNNENGNKSVTVDDLLMSAGTATQPRDYTNGNKNSQGSIQSIGRDLQIKQLLLKTISKQCTLENESGLGKTLLNSLAQKYKNGDIFLIESDSEKESKLEELMLNNKVYSPEPLNDYNASLFEHLKATNTKLEHEGNDIEDKLKIFNLYAPNFQNFLETSNTDDKTLLDDEIKKYEDKDVKSNMLQLDSLDKDILKLDQYLTSNIKKNLQETLVLKIFYAETEKQINDRLLQISIFKKNESKKQISGSDYINEYLSLNIDR
ncbi:hypothetical protein QEN19_000119 [Hanseniaspora menglaensis]